MSTELIRSHDDLMEEARAVADRAGQAIAALIRTRDPAIRDEIGAAKDLARSLREGLVGFIESQREIRRRRLAGFMVGWAEPDGRRWFVAHCWNAGNLVRTPDPEFAALWDTVEQVEAWITDLKRPRGRDAKGRKWPPPLIGVSGKRLKVYRVGLEVKATGTSFPIPDLQLARDRQEARTESQTEE